MVERVMADPACCSTISLAKAIDDGDHYSSILLISLKRLV